MGIKTGVVTGQDIIKYRGGDEVRILQVKLLGASPESVEWFDITGEDTAPVNGDKVVVWEVAENYKIAVATKDLITAAVSAGERKIYSRNSAGAVQAFIHLKDDGSIDASVPGDLNVDGNLNVGGDITATGDISAEGDVVADSAGLAISLIDHYHLGNLGRQTSPSMMTGGSAPPSNPPTTDANGDVITGTKGTSLDDHDHPYTWTDPAGSGNTGAPN